MIYLAAAVSDFYIHPNDMVGVSNYICGCVQLYCKICFLLKVEHKIHSSSDLILRFRPVPKLLSHVAQEWAPESLIVSFKVTLDISKLFMMTFVVGN